MMRGLILAIWTLAVCLLLAAMLAQSALDDHNRRLARIEAVVWGTGEF